MASYLVEAYQPKVSADGIAAIAVRARAAAQELAAAGTPVRYLRCVFVPEDEVCFYAFDAPSADVVREATARAGLAYERILEAEEER